MKKNVKVAAISTLRHVKVRVAALRNQPAAWGREMGFNRAGWKRAEHFAASSKQARHSLVGRVASPFKAAATLARG